MGFGCNALEWGNWGAWHRMGAGGVILGLVFWTALLVLLTLTVIWVVRQLRLRPQPVSTSGESPLEAAQRRLAAGEISVGEFDEIAHRLEARSAPADR